MAFAILFKIVWVYLSKALTAGQPVGEQSKNINFELDPSTTSTMYVMT